MVYTCTQAFNKDFCFGSYISWDLCTAFLSNYLPAFSHCTLWKPLQHWACGSLFPGSTEPSPCVASTSCFSVDKLNIIPPLTRPLQINRICFAFCGITHIVSLSVGLHGGCVYMIPCSKSPMLKRGLSTAFDTARPGYPCKNNLLPRVDISQGTQGLNNQ